MLQRNYSNRGSGYDYSHIVGEPRVPQATVKIPRTYGWLCPFEGYKSDKHYNTQRHINLRHGYGSGEPIDSLTGLTREQKRRNALGQDTSSISIHGNSYNTNSLYRPIDSAQLRYDSGSSQSCVNNQNAFQMRLLNDATKRVQELGYCQNVSAGIQMINNTPNDATHASGRAQRSYSVRPDFQPRQGMIPANLPHPNPNQYPNPHSPLTVPQTHYVPSDDLSQTILHVPQNALLRRNLALNNLFKDPW
jgi:hypothetical protein